MAIQGSVVSAPTVTALTLTAETVTFPTANLQVVKVIHSAVYVQIPIDSSRVGILPSAGGNTTYAASNGAQITGTGRNVNFPVTGTVLNYSVYSLSTTPVMCFYYGTPVSGSKPLSAYAGVAAAVTLSSGAGSGTFTFPSGDLNMTGITGTMGLVSGDGSGVLEVTWNTSSGRTFNAFILGNMVTQIGGDLDILPLDLTVAQTVAFTITLGTTADKTVIYAYYK